MIAPANAEARPGCGMRLRVRESAVEIDAGAVVADVRSEVVHEREVAGVMRNQMADERDRQRWSRGLLEGDRVVLIGRLMVAG